MAESQAQVERSGTKENPSNRVPKQRVIDQAFSSQETFAALCAASTQDPAQEWLELRAASSCLIGAWQPGLLHLYNIDLTEFIKYGG